MGISSRTTVALLLVLSFCTGCGTIQKTRQTLAATPRIYAVSTDDTAFYSHSPQQGSGPDRTLSRNTLVRLIRPSFGFAKVQLLDDSAEGYVSSDEIRIAPPALIEAATATPPPVAVISNTPAGEQFDLNSADPRLSAPPEQLPAADASPIPSETPGDE